MSEASILSAAPEHISIGDKQLRMAPLTLKDQGEFERWARQRLAETSKVLVGDNVDLILSIASRLNSLGYWDSEIRGTLNSVGGQVFSVYLGCRSCDPSVTIAMIEAMTTEERRTAARLWWALNYPESVLKKDDAPLPASP